MNRHELIVMYSLALATRAHTDHRDTIDSAVQAVDYLLETLAEEDNYDVSRSSYGEGES